MNVSHKVRLFRELNQWSQEEMAEKMNMSVQGYAKIERGETNLTLHKLKQIAAVFQISLTDLISSTDNSVIFFSGEHNGEHSQNHYGNNYYGNKDAEFEIEKLKLIIQHKDELLQQKESELENLKSLLNILKMTQGGEK